MKCDVGNYRIEVFELSGKFVTKSGKQDSDPISLTATLSQGRIYSCV